LRSRSPKESTGRCPHTTRGSCFLTEAPIEQEEFAEFSLEAPEAPIEDNAAEVAPKALADLPAETAPAPMIGDWWSRLLKAEVKVSSGRITPRLEEIGVVVGLESPGLSMKVLLIGGSCSCHSLCPSSSLDSGIRLQSELTELRGFGRR
jgi:hypothetical protein